MQGVSVIGELLAAHAPLVAVVPVERVKAGALPQNIILPAIAVTSVSSNDRNILSSGEDRRVVERVQVTILAKDYRAKGQILALVRAACADKRGDFAGVTAVSVVTDGVGPDFMSDDASMWMGSQDFSVSFNEAVA